MRPPLRLLTSYISKDMGQHTDQYEHGNDDNDDYSLEATNCPYISQPSPLERATPT